MGTENEFDINPSEAAAIADFFREADRKFTAGNGTLDDMYAEYVMQFGGLDFALLERAFRAQNLNTHFLAVPSSDIEKIHPHLMVVDYNDLFFHQKETRKSFVAIPLPNFAELRGFADGYEMSHNPEQNLRNLRQAGILVPRSRTIYKGTPEARRMN